LSAVINALASPRLRSRVEFRRCRLARMESGRRSRSSVEILSIDQEEPAQLFTGFGKRSIGYQRFAVAYPNTSCGRDWVERGGCEILPLRVELLRELRDSHNIARSVLLRAFSPGKSVVHISLNCLLVTESNGDRSNRHQKFYHPLVGLYLCWFLSVSRTAIAQIDILLKIFMSGMAPNTKPDVDQAIASVYRAE